MDTSKQNRIKQLDALLAMIDSPKEGDEIIFTLSGDPKRYHGKIEKRTMGDNTSIYQIKSKTKSPPGRIETVEYKGHIFHTGGWQQI
jgi:hypothetical protein